jgi:NAD(P)-dependent dehydrogenase (short-subunit alcohol dehydrogenase family)
MDISGIALVTGAGSGIGKACALTYARDGCSGLALLDISQEGLLATKKELEEKAYIPGGKPLRVETYVLNVADEDQVNNTFDAVVNAFGRVDYVASAAGLAFKHKGGIAYAKTEDWKRVTDVNINGTFYVLRAATKQMLQQERILSAIDGRPLQRGSIVNFGSIQGHIATPTSTSYVASKHAIIGLTKTASEDYAKDGIRINAICPGYTITPMTNTPEILKVMEEKVAVMTPMGRAAMAQEIADGVIYLSGGRSSYVTGTSLFVDGGYMQR